MARRRRNNRRRRGNFSFLYKALSIVLICGAIVLAMALFFKVDTVVVTGNTRYNESEILAASGVQTGDNLFLMNKYNTARQIYQKLSYVQSVRINRKLPDTLLIEVTECTSAGAVEQDGSVWLLCDSGKIVDQTDASHLAEYARITGLTLLDPAVGTVAQADTESAACLPQLLALMTRLQEKSMLANVQEIHLEDAACLRIRYAARFTVEIPWNADFNYKLNNLNAVVGQLQDNEKGTISLMQDGKASFIPG